MFEKFFAFWGGGRCQKRGRESIQVGCVPPSCRSYPIVSHVRGVSTHHPPDIPPRKDMGPEIPTIVDRQTDKVAARYCFYTYLWLCSQEGLCQGGGGPLSRGGSLSGWSLFGVVSFQGVSVRGGLCQGDPLPHRRTVTCWRYVSYWNAFLFK